MTRAEVVEHLKTLTEEERYELLEEASSLRDEPEETDEEVAMLLQRQADALSGKSKTIRVENLQEYLHERAAKA